jgi:hypothetical protein
VFRTRSKNDQVAFGFRRYLRLLPRMGTAPTKDTWLGLRRRRYPRFFGLADWDQTRRGERSPLGQEIFLKKIQNFKARREKKFFLQKLF